MICDTFAIVRVPFPFVEQAKQQYRPALVVSSYRFNSEHNVSVCATITRAQANPWVSDVPIENWSAAGLNAACYIRFKIFSLDNTLIEKQLGALPDATRHTFKEQWERYFRNITVL
jgi:mRNA interferase MazF